MFRGHEGQRFNDHVFALTNDGWKTSVSSRDVLRTNPSLRREYERLKRTLVTDRDDLKDTPEGKASSVVAFFERRSTTMNSHWTSIGNYYGCPTVYNLDRGIDARCTVATGLLASFLVQGVDLVKYFFREIPPHIRDAFFTHPVENKRVMDAVLNGDPPR